MCTDLGMNPSEPSLISDPRPLQGSSSDEWPDYCNDICRDFLRNVCSRGHHCRFRHPVNRLTPEVEERTPKRPVCHDYQNGGCRRKELCRFEHVTRKREKVLRDKAGAGMGALGCGMDLEDWNGSAGCIRKNNDEDSMMITDEVHLNEIRIAALGGYPVHRLQRNKRRSRRGIVAIKCRPIPDRLR